MGNIVGFAILQYPDADERWTRVGKQIMMELSVVEVSRAWRSGWDRHRTARPGYWTIL
jgi:hypothetical protein